MVRGNSPRRRSIPTPITLSVLERVLGHATPLDNGQILEKVFALEFATRWFPTTGAPNPQDIARTLLVNVGEIFSAFLWNRHVVMIQKFSTWWDALINDYAVTRAELLPNMSGVPVGIVLVPVYSAAESKLQTQYFVIAEQLTAVLQYAHGLLLNDEYEFGRLLSRCRLPECRRLFLASSSKRGGRPRRLYCTESHMKLAHDRAAPARVAHHRAKQKVGRGSR